MCGSRKYPYSPHRRPLEVPRGRRVIKPELLEEKYEDKLEFSSVCVWGGGRAKQNKKQQHLWGEYYAYQLSMQRGKFRAKVLPLKLRCCHG